MNQTHVNYETLTKIESQKKEAIQSVSQSASQPASKQASKKERKKGGKKGKKSRDGSMQTTRVACMVLSKARFRESKHARGIVLEEDFARNRKGDEEEGRKRKKTSKRMRRRRYRE